MKKIFILFCFLLCQYGLLYAVSYTCTVTIDGHTSQGTYNSYPVFVVNSNETLKFGLASSSGDWKSFKIDGVAQTNLNLISAYPTTQLEKGVLHCIQLRRQRFKADGSGIDGMGTYYIYNGTCYIIINTPSQSTCSKTSKKIGIWHNGGNISRWERSYDGGSTWTNIACTDYQYTEENPAAGTAMYRVLATDNSYSDVVTITYVDAVPSTIQALPATNTKTVDESITLTADVEDNGYSYQWKKNGTDISGATQSAYTISTIKSSHAGNYTCYVSNGCNGITTTVAKLTVNKCAQTIDFPEIPVQTYSSGLTYTLPKTTNKGLTITYQSMNTSVATVSGNVLTIKAPGTAIISASQVGNADYLEATQVSRTLTVNKRNQVISSATYE